jgi:hypothetical protein
MKFSTKKVKVGNKKVDKFFINEREVTQDTYNTLFDEQKEREAKFKSFKATESEQAHEEDGECCPRCAVIKDIVQDILDAESDDEAFEILKDFINFAEECSYNEGYKDALINQIGIASRILEHIENEEVE